MTPDHFVLGIIWRLVPGGPGLEFLVMDTRSQYPGSGTQTVLQTKFPGGMCREVIPAETPELTLQREILEETSLAILPGRATKIWEKKLPGHTKYAFLVPFEACRGELRKETMRERGDELESPRWERAETLGRILFHSHQEAYLEALRQFSLA